MVFNSLNFALFLPLVFFVYWFLVSKNLRLQNLLLLFSSYFFYATWDWRFLFLLLFSTLIDYISGIQIDKSPNENYRKTFFWSSILINLGFLGIFKYYNFFAESFTELFSSIGISLDPWTLSIILPVGISFYTFHGLSYVMDVYNRKIKAERSFIDYGVFVSFFPLLVAGPIERATHLLPQIKKPRSFDYVKAVDGLKQILWGLFKKAVIADNCAYYVNQIFHQYEDLSGSTLLLGVFLFSIQIYGDFSGYSDMALGTARLFGIELLKNFSFPYFSRNIAEFWRRWHISLSSWFKDYLYIPLGGSQVGLVKKIRNTFIIFLVSGFWHGANWTFLAWGFLNAVYILPSIWKNKNREYLEIVAKGRKLPTWKEFFLILFTFTLTMFGWLLFRSESLTQAGYFIITIFSDSLFTFPDLKNIAMIYPTIAFILLFFLLEWNGREGNYAIENNFKSNNRMVRWGFYYFILILVFVFAGSGQQFIYFQF